jgi:hypothetical protein
MPEVTRCRTAALLVLAALALAACAGGGEDDYGDELPRLNREIAALGDAVGVRLRDAARSTDAELAADFRGYARRLGELRRRAEGLEPPERLAARHEELLAAMSAVRAALEDVAEAARRSDPAAARAAAARLVRDAERLDQARRRLAA